jgi:hypothetical protein
VTALCPSCNKPYLRVSRVVDDDEPTTEDRVAVVIHTMVTDRLGERIGDSCAVLWPMKGEVRHGS